jgi:hypothetical protein
MHGGAIGSGRGFHLDKSPIGNGVRLELHDCEYELQWSRLSLHVSNPYFNFIFVHQMDAIIVFGAVVCILLWYGTQHKTSYNRVPKKIWTYWREQPNGLVMPSKEELQCLASWKQWNPEYEIVTLTKKTLKGYVTIPQEIREHPNFSNPPSYFVDLVRLWTLAEHGGVWLDPNVLVKAPLDKWMFPKYAEFSGFYAAAISPQGDSAVGPKGDSAVGGTQQAAHSAVGAPKIATWFMAANKKCEMVRSWTDAFSKLANYPHLDHYLKSHANASADLNTADPVQIAFQEIFVPSDSIILQKARNVILPMPLSLTSSMPLASLPQSLPLASSP